MQDEKEKLMPYGVECRMEIFERVFKGMNASKKELRSVVANLLNERKEAVLSVIEDYITEGVNRVHDALNKQKEYKKSLAKMDESSCLLRASLEPQAVCHLNNYENAVSLTEGAANVAMFAAGLREGLALNRDFIEDAFANAILREVW